MPPAFKAPTWAPPAALAYITLGALLTAWSLVGGLYVYRHPLKNLAPYYIGAGVLGTGLVLLAIGVSLGWIARSARKAELPPEEPGDRPAG